MEREMFGPVVAWATSGLNRTQRVSDGWLLCSTLS
jgi:hypothetical protein